MGGFLVSSFVWGIEVTSSEVVVMRAVLQVGRWMIRIT